MEGGFDLTCQGRIVLDAVVQIDLCKIEPIFSIRLVQEISHGVGDEATKRRGKVESLADLLTHLDERDVLPVSRKDTWWEAHVSIIDSCARETRTVVGHGVQRRTSASTVTRFRGDILWPLPARSWVSLRHHMSDGEFGGDQVEDGEHEIERKYVRVEEQVVYPAHLVVLVVGRVEGDKAVIFEKGRTSGTEDVCEPIKTREFGF